jgi:hypothetical protein
MRGGIGRVTVHPWRCEREGTETVMANRCRVAGGLAWALAMAIAGVPLSCTALRRPQQWF